MARLSFLFTRLSLLALLFTFQLNLNGQDVPEDFERKLGTKSLEAAKQFQQGVAAYRAKKYEDSVNHFKEAIKQDANFQLSFYWLAQAYEAVGNHKQEMITYEQLYESRTHELNSIVVEGCINAGLTQGKKGEFESSEFWFSRALRLDPENKFNKAAQAYRNLAITKFNKKDYSSAALVAILGNRIDSKKVEKSMIEAAAKRAKREVATIVEAPSKTEKKLAYRDELGAEGDAQEIAGVTESLGGIVDAYTDRKLIAFPQDGKSLYMIDYANRSPSKGLEAVKVAVQGRPRAAAYVAGRLFLSITSPHRLAEINVDTGKEIRNWELDEAAPNSIAVAPSKNVAYLCSKSVIRILNLKTGKISLSEFEATGIASDPRQEHVYAFRTPPGKSNEQRGHFLVKGRPVFFTIQNESFDWSQSTLMRFIISETGQLLLSQVRLNASSNAKQIHVSADGRVVAVVGGGGWRPLDQVSGSGYGVPFFNAWDFSNVHRFVKTGAYPQTAAISPINHLIFASGGKSVLSHIVNDDQKEIAITGKQQFAKFSGDGRWLFVGNGSKLFSIALKPTKEDYKNRQWYKN